MLNPILLLLFLPVLAWAGPQEEVQAARRDCLRNLPGQVRSHLGDLNRETSSAIRRFCEEGGGSSPWQDCLMAYLARGSLTNFSDARYVCHPNMDPSKRSCLINYLANERFMPGPYQNSYHDYSRLCEIENPSARGCIKNLIVSGVLNRVGHAARNICKRRSQWQRSCWISYHRGEAPFNNQAVFGSPVDEDKVESYCKISHPEIQQCVIDLVTSGKDWSWELATVTCLRGNSNFRSRCEQKFLQYGFSLSQLRASEVCSLGDYQLISCVKDKLDTWSRRNAQAARTTGVPHRNLELFVLHCNLYNLYNALDDGLYSPGQFACDLADALPTSPAEAPVVDTWGTDAD